MISDLYKMRTRTSRITLIETRSELSGALRSLAHCVEHKATPALHKDAHVLDMHFDNGHDIDIINPFRAILGVVAVALGQCAAMLIHGNLT